MARVRLSIDTFLDETLEEVRLECQSSESEEGKDRVLVVLVGLGQEELDNLEVLLSLLRLQASELEIGYSADPIRFP